MILWFYILSVIDQKFAAGFCIAVDYFCTNLSSYLQDFFFVQKALQLQVLERFVRIGSLWSCKLQKSYCSWAEVL